MAVLTTQNGATQVVGDHDCFSNLGAFVTPIMVHGARFHITFEQRQFSDGYISHSVLSLLGAVLLIVFVLVLMKFI